LDNEGAVIDLAQRPLDGVAFYWLVAAMFSVTLGYGFLCNRFLTQ